MNTARESNLSLETVLSDPRPGDVVQTSDGFNIRVDAVADGQVDTHCYNGIVGYPERLSLKEFRAKFNEVLDASVFRMASR